MQTGPGGLKALQDHLVQYLDEFSLILHLARRQDFELGVLRFVIFEKHLQKKNKTHLQLEEALEAGVSKACHLGWTFHYLHFVMFEWTCVNRADVDVFLREAVSQLKTNQRQSAREVSKQKTQKETEFLGRGTNLDDLAVSESLPSQSLLLSSIVLFLRFR